MVTQTIFSRSYLLRVQTSIDLSGLEVRSILSVRCVENDTASLCQWRKTQWKKCSEWPNLPFNKYCVTRSLWRRPSTVLPASDAWSVRQEIPSLSEIATGLRAQEHTKIQSQRGQSGQKIHVKWRFTSATTNPKKYVILRLIRDIAWNLRNFSVYCSLNLGKLKKSEFE